MNIQKDISFGLAFRVWWHFFWRYVAFGLAGGILLGTLMGFLGALANINIHHVTSLSVLFGSVLVLWIQIWVVRGILTRNGRISKYRLVLIEDQP